MFHKFIGGAVAAAAIAFTGAATAQSAPGRRYPLQGTALSSAGLATGADAAAAVNPRRQNAKAQL